LAKRQLEQDSDGKAQLDRYVCEDFGPAHLARRLRKPPHLRVDQDQQRPTPLKRAVVHVPVRDTVAGRMELAHPARLTHWIQKANPQTIDFCNNAGMMRKVVAFDGHTVRIADISAARSNGALETTCKYSQGIETTICIGF
jgi:hypothetical protein